MRHGVISKGFVGNGIVGKALLLDIVGGMDMLSFSNIDESLVGARVVARGVRMRLAIGILMLLDELLMVVVLVMVVVVLIVLLLQLVVPKISSLRQAASGWVLPGVTHT